MSGVIESAMKIEEKKRAYNELLKLYDKLKVERVSHKITYDGVTYKIFDISQKESEELTEMINRWESKNNDKNHTDLLEDIKNAEARLYNSMVEERKYKCDCCFEEITDKEEIELAKNGVGLCNACYEKE